MKRKLWFVVLVFSTVVGLNTPQADAAPLLALEHIGNDTYDPNTGLEWLDLSLTAGQSYDSVLYGWNGYTTTMGYRFATRDEVIQLFDEAGAGYIGNPPAPTNSHAASFLLSLLGTTYSGPELNENRSWMFYDPSTEPTLPGPYVPEAVFGVTSEGGFFDVPGIYAATNLSSFEMASALVRVVPEPLPATLAIIFLGLSIPALKRLKRS